ncbi:MAG TPA: hypothetical protein VMU59_00875 [Caulobacteraceae bacterium]|nr:hypothetical protein [Caulobacteraceae bacterium]
MIAKSKARRLSKILAAASTAALLCGFQATQNSRPSLSDAAMAVTNPEAPPVKLPANVLEAASVYIAYIDRAAGISPAFTDGPSVQDSLRRAEAIETKQMARGMTAYAAIVALQEPTFVASVRKFGADPVQRGQVAQALLADPRYATAFPGADRAAGLIVAALTDQGQRVEDTGKRVKQAAYDVQHQSWSKGVVSDRDGRLALAKSLSETQLTADADAESRMQQAATGATPLLVSGAADAGPYTPTIERALAVAAMAALGDGGEDFSEPLNALLTVPEQSDCLHDAKLDLYECLAVAKPHYEDVFCLGQHVLADAGACIIKSVTPYVAPPPVLIKATDTKPAPVKSRARKKKVVKH